MAEIIFFVLISSLCFSFVVSNDSTPIPLQRSQVDQWFLQNVPPLATRKDTVDPILVNAEATQRIINVRKDGRGAYKTITDAVRSIPSGNKNRVVVLVGPGVYEEKIKIESDKPFITLYGDPNNLPTLVFNDSGPKVGTLNSGSLTVDSDYFVGVNLKIMNSTPRNSGQAVAMTIRGEKAAFFNCRFHGFQDTLCDQGRNHFYKDCYVEGTVDFIFGDGKSIFLNTMISVISGELNTWITAHSRGKPDEDTGYSMVHSTVTGRGGVAFLGRPWGSYARVIFAYCDLYSVVNLQGWSIRSGTTDNQTVYFGEYNNWGPASGMSRRVPYAKHLSYKDAEPFMKLAYISGSTWLLPPPKYF